MKKTDYTGIYVTGGFGWLGRRLVEVLRERFPTASITCLALPGSSSPTSGIEIIEGDLRNPTEVSRFLKNARGGLVFHTAGVIHPSRVKEFYEVNVEGTRHLLDEAINQGVTRLVAMSSNSPCGSNLHPDQLFDENSPSRPYLNYGRSKAEMEEFVLAAARNRKIETTIIRSPWFYGPNQPPRQSLFFTLVKKGKMPILGNGEQLRSMAYIDNICEGMYLAAIHPESSGKVYWIADERPYSMNEIVETVAKILKKDFGLPVKSKTLRLPWFLGQVAELMDRIIQKTGAYHQKIHVLSEMNKTIACNISRAKQELGYTPLVSLEEGMRRSIQWCIENGINI